MVIEKTLVLDGIETDMLEVINNNILPLQDMEVMHFVFSDGEYKKNVLHTFFGNYDRDFTSIYLN